jgi:quinoprotein glucose dehydrogenase
MTIRTQRRMWLTMGALAVWMEAFSLSAQAQRAAPPAAQARPAAPSSATRATTASLRARQWPGYGGGPQQIRYSPLSQVNKRNVKQLQVAWTYDTGEPGAMQTQPVVVDGVLYGYTPTHKAFAVKADTGAPLWTFDSGIRGSGPNRGVMYWEGPAPSRVEDRDRRIFAAVGNFIYALEAATGKPIPAFGTDGRIDLRENLGRDPQTQGDRLTSPGVIYKDLMIVGGRVGESLPTSPGDIRAYDVRTGALKWTFHTIPHPGEFGYETWPKDAWLYGGAANSWPGMALDEARGIVFVPTGSAATDFYGADRIGDNLFANSLLALDAATGTRIWHFQAVRHDMWDRDFPSPPSLVTITQNGRTIDAVAQATKHGFLFLFDRTNGQPIFPIEYKTFPASNVPGEVARGEQPLPGKPRPFARQLLTEDLLTTRTPEMHAWALEQFKTFRSEGQFVPLGIDKPTVVFPGFDGGAEWGGQAFDPQTGLYYVNANDLAWTGTLAPNTGGQNGQALYLRNCASCHRDDRVGTPPTIPSLIDIGGRRSFAEMSTLIRQGAGRMPGQPTLDQAAVNAIIQYVTTGQDAPAAGGRGGGQGAGGGRGRAGAPGPDGVTGRSGTPTPDAVTGGAPPPAATGRGGGPGPVDPRINTSFRFTGYRKFLDPDGYPATATPWGTLSAINLNTGEYAWQVPLGEYPELVAQGLKNTGSENYGGPVVTAGGLVFIGATNADRKLRAFDKATGQLLWETVMPGPGRATPAVYEMNGRQFIVIATGSAGGGGRGAPAAAAPAGPGTNGAYIAFALPKR